ncbi:hypothetical protein SESBI_08214 [Sesbania bispinosa]|nr:hypothetical protein SESBI_08214 [Sesbania bispinosa]
MAGCSSKDCLQVGQEECERSHVSMHLTWNPWPFEAKRATASSGVSKANLRLHLRAQRTIELSPRAHISAQSKAAKINTMLVSKFELPVKDSLDLLMLPGEVELESVSSKRRWGR